MNRMNPMFLASLMGMAAGAPGAPPAIPGTRPQSTRHRRVRPSRPNEAHYGPPYKRLRETDRRRRQIERGQLTGANGLVRP